jgi:AraC-like DNA-binding protein
VNLALQTGGSALYGVGKRRFAILLEGRGEVVGTKFRPGMFGAFLRAPVATLTGKAIALGEVFDAAEAQALERSALRASGSSKKASLLDAFIRERLPIVDEGAILARDAAELALRCHDVTGAEDLAQRCGVPLRTLQRLFHRHVGVAPKWVIRRARVQEAAERVAAGQPVAWASLAGELGYFDQSHLVRDFRAQVGETPAVYAARCARQAGRAGQPE